MIIFCLGYLHYLYFNCNKNRSIPKFWANLVIFWYCARTSASFEKKSNKRCIKSKTQLIALPSKVYSYFQNPSYPNAGINTILILGDNLSNSRCLELYFEIGIATYRNLKDSAVVLRVELTG